MKKYILENNPELELGSALVHLTDTLSSEVDPKPNEKTHRREFIVPEQASPGSCIRGSRGTGGQQKPRIKPGPAATSAPLGRQACWLW